MRLRFSKDGNKDGGKAFELSDLDTLEGPVLQGQGELYFLRDFRLEYSFIFL